MSRCSRSTRSRRSAPRAQISRPPSPTPSNSIYALTTLQAVANDANATESFWLVAYDDLDKRKAYETLFKSLSNEIVGVDIKDALAAEAARRKFPGLLGDELSNITFAGELRAAEATLKTWAAYVGIDGQLRALQNAGKHAEAMALDIGVKPGQSNWAFDQFQKALLQTIKINQDAFDAAIASAEEPDQLPSLRLSHHRLARGLRRGVAGRPPAAQRIRVLNMALVNGGGPHAAELAREWRERISKIARNLTDFNDSEACVRVKGRMSDATTAYQGRTAEAAREALGALDALWQDYLLLSRVVDDADALAKKSGILSNHDGEVVAMLTGPSIKLPVVSVPVQQRGLLDSPEHQGRVAPQAVLEVDDQGF